jgi:hypothetical protein
MLTKILLILAVVPLLIVLWASALSVARQYLSGAKATLLAAKKVRDACRNRKNCPGCILYDPQRESCNLYGSLPSEWKI